MPAPVPITDIHIHVNGPRAAAVFEEVSRIFGVSRLLSQTRWADAEAVKAIFGERIDFVAVPNWADPDKGRMFRDGFLEEIQRWHDRWGARIVKLWAAPRSARASRGTARRPSTSCGTTCPGPPRGS